MCVGSSCMVILKTTIYPFHFVKRKKKAHCRTMKNSTREKYVVFVGGAGRKSEDRCAGKVCSVRRGILDVWETCMVGVCVFVCSCVENRRRSHAGEIN